MIRIDNSLSKIIADSLYQPVGSYITSLTTSTPTNLTGFIKGNGSVLSADNSTYYKSGDSPLFLKVTITGLSAPTIAAGSGAGAAPTVFITGGNSAGEITLTTGTTALPNDDLLTATFSEAFTNAPAVILYPSNGNACALSGATAVYVTSAVGTLTIMSGTTKLADSTEYKWFYHCIGT